MKPVSEAEVSIAGATRSPGAPEITVSGTPISPGSNALILGTSAVPLQTELPQQSIITVAGHISTAAPTGCSIAGTRISPGGQAVDIAGTAVSLDASSHLQIGFSTGNLGETAASATPQLLTVAGQAVAANPTAVEIAGFTLTLGGSGMTISETRVLLDSPGGLVVDSKTVPVEMSTAGPGRLIMGEFSSTG